MYKARDAANTPFVRFVSGTVVDPPNSIFESALEVLSRLKEHPPREAFLSLVREGFVGGQHTVLPEATWYALLRDFLTYYEREFSPFEKMEAVSIIALELMTEKPPESAWEKLERLLLDSIDDLSGWNNGWIKDDAEKRNVFKGDDGNYYFHDKDGILVQIIGAKTLPETHLDFLANAIMTPFGPIRQIMNVFSLFSISEDFVRNRNDYPKSLRLLISEPKFGMLSPRWYRMQFHQVRTSRWRPKNNLCDPEWLSELLMAKVTDGLDRDVWLEYVDKFKERENKLDADCPFEIDYVLDSDLIIGDEGEIYFQFEGRTFRWINGTPESRAVLSVGHKEQRNTLEADESINRLLSYLVWQHRVPIRKMDGAGGPRRSIPLTWGPRLSGGVKVDPRYLFVDFKGGNYPKRDLALALYKEGVNAESVFHRFLSFWKILEVAIPKKDVLRPWINTNVHGAICEGGRVAVILTKTSDVADYLYNSGRCAIAHVLRKPYINPDNYEDNVRISKDVRLIEELARMAINEKLMEKP